MPGEVKAGEKLRSTLRQDQSQLTRDRILGAASRLFVERGYGQVTMQEIAREAGVAYQTVFSQFGSKLQLALELCNSEMAHVGEAVAMVVEARDAGDPVAWLQILGRFARRLYEPCGEVLRFMRESGDPDLISRLAEIDARRLQLLAELGPRLENTGHLRRGTSAQAAVDLVWSLTSPATYQQLVLDRGWTPDQFEQWLGPALAGLVLAS